MPTWGIDSPACDYCGQEIEYFFIETEDGHGENCALFCRKECMDKYNSPLYQALTKDVE